MFWTDWINTLVYTDSPHWPIMGKMLYPFSLVVLIRCFLYLKVLRTCLTYWTSLNFNQKLTKRIHVFIMGNGFSTFSC